MKNGNGDTWIGEVAGEARVSAANGDIAIDVAHAGVLAKTANGGVRLGEVSVGSAVAETAFGDLEVGVRNGVAACLDLNTGFGNVRQRPGRRRRARARGRDRRGQGPQRVRRHLDPPRGGRDVTAVDLLAECVAGVLALALGAVRALTANSAIMLAPVAAWLAFLLVVLTRAR